MRLPRSVFAPYTDTATNLLFFTKGEPTKEVWFYEHPLPAGKKAYSKTKPIKYEEFEPEKSWWDNREENEFAWKVSADQIKARGYNLDIKNPNKPQDADIELHQLLESHLEKKVTLKDIATKLANKLDSIHKETESSKIEFLIQNIYELIEIPGIEKLLTSALIQTAIEGQLVGHDNSEGSGDDLIDDIREARRRAIESGAIRRQKELPPINIDLLPYDIPPNWQFTRLGEISNYGQSEKKKPAEVNANDWSLDLEDIEKETSTILQRYMAKDRNSSSDKNVFYEGDVLYGKLRPYLNKVVVADASGVCSTEIMPIRAYGGYVDPEFLMYVLRSNHFLDYVNKLTYGVKMPRLGTEDGRKALIPIPPQAEQKRIVANLNSLLEIVGEIKSATSAD